MKGSGGVPANGGQGRMAHRVAQHSLSRSSSAASATAAKLRRVHVRAREDSVGSSPRTGRLSSSWPKIDQQFDVAVRSVAMTQKSVHGEIDRILAMQLLVVWAGEGRSDPKRLGWWDTDLIDEAGGGDLIARLAPRTHVWASLELVREAARRVDARARGKHGDPDKLRTIFFLGFDIDEKVADRLSELKRQGRAPEEALPLPFKLGSVFEKDRVLEELARPGKVAFDRVPPAGRQLKGAVPSSPGELVQKLTAALVPVADEYPFPFFEVGA